MFTFLGLFAVVFSLFFVYFFDIQELSFVERNFFTNERRYTERATSQLRPPNPEVEQPPSPSILHNYEKCAVCSDSRECSEIGKNILQNNGSAMDAAIAALLCNGLLAMQSMGLGGGVIMNVYIKAEERAYSILGREVAPLNVLPEMYSHLKSIDSLLAETGLSIALPAEVMAYAEAYDRFGKLPWNDLVRPTIEICRKGYKLSKHQHDALHTNRKMIAMDPLLTKMFINSSTGEFHRIGYHIIIPQQLCRTYEFLAEDGPRSFYTNGQRLAELVKTDLHALNSSINQTDMNALRVAVVPSFQLQLENGFQLHLTPPPSSGYILGLIMNILDKFKYDFRNEKQLTDHHIHLIVEALKFGFVQRWQLDIAASESLLSNLTCPHYASLLAQSIEKEQTLPHPRNYGAQMDLLSRTDYGTGHISVLAPNGDAVSATSSINFYFGSGRTGEHSGIVFNNALADFSIPGLQNYFDLPVYGMRNLIQAGRSPMSSMAPLIVTHRDGSVRLVVGAAGGTKIISALTQILMRILWLGQTIKEAIDAPRFHHQLLPNILQYEYGLVESLVEDLEQKGHTTQRFRYRGSSVCGIERVENIIAANADYRKEGDVVGF